MTSLNDRFKDDEQDGGQRDQAARGVGRDGHGELGGNSIGLFRFWADFGGIFGQKLASKASWVGQFS